MSFIHNNTNNNHPIEHSHSHSASHLSNRHLTKLAFITTQIIAVILITLSAVLLGCNLIGLGVGLALVGLGVATLSIGVISLLVKNVKTAIKNRQELHQKQIALAAEKKIEETARIAKENAASAAFFKEKYITTNNLYTSQHQKLEQQQEQLSNLRTTFETTIKKLITAKETLSTEIEEKKPILENKRELLQPKLMTSEAFKVPCEKKLQTLEGELQQAKIQKQQLSDQLNAIKYNFTQKSTANDLKRRIKDFNDQIFFLNQQINLEKDKLIQLGKKNQQLNIENLNLNREEAFLDSKKNALEKILGALKTDSEILKQISATQTSINTSLEDLQEFLPLIKELTIFTAPENIEKDSYNKLATLNSQLALTISEQNDNLIPIKEGTHPTDLDQLSLDIEHQIK